MALSDKLPPASDDREHIPPELVEQSARLAEELATPAEAGEEYELAGDPPAADEAGVVLHVALARARADMPKVGKKDLYNATGTRFNFRGVDRVVNATRPVLARHGISIWPELQGVDRRDVARKDGSGRNVETLVRVRFHVVGPLGDKLPAPLVVIGEALDTSDKGGAKAMSVAWRVALIQLLHIATGDPDPDSMMIERGEEIDRGQAAFDPEVYRQEALRPTTSHARLNQMINDLQKLGHGAEPVPNEFGEQEKLGSMLVRLRNERRAGAGDAG